ncbi:MAG: glycoside hydrolase, partial [Bacteroidota bacterium]
PYVPDAFINTTDGRGITWGISHLTNVTTWAQNHSMLLRFDCDLSRDLHDPEMKKHSYYYKPEFYFRHGLSKAQRERIKNE